MPNEQTQAGEAIVASPRFRLETLKNRAQFKHAARGIRVNRPCFTLQHCPAPLPPVQSLEVAAKGWQFGFTVTKKLGNSPKRNRIKRRLRAMVCKAAPLLPAAGMQIVILAREGAVRASFSQMVDDFTRAIKRLESTRASP